MNFKEAHELFLDYGEAKGFAKGTLAAYSQDARNFLKFLTEKQLTLEVEEINSKMLRQYNVWLKQRGYALGTIGRRLDSMSSFLEYLVNDDIIETNPMKKVDRPQLDDRLPVFLTRKELDRLIKAVDNSSGSYWLRDRAVIRVLAYTGLRRSELFALDWEDIDFGKGTALIKKTKSKKDRIVPLNTEVQNCLWEYLQSRLPLSNKAVALNRLHNRMDANTLSRIVRKYSNKARINKHVTPHTLRHTCASLLIEAGVDIVTVAQIMGHRDIQTTTIYTHTTPNRLAAAVSLLTSTGKQ